MIVRIFVALVMLVCLSGPAGAANPRDEWERNQARMKEAETEGEKLEQEQKKLQDELAALQKKLVPSADQVQRFEAELSASEDKLLILNSQLAKKEAELDQMKKRQSKMAMAALSLSQTPPEAVVMLPGEQLKTMQAARALELTTKSLEQEAQSIQQQWQELQALRAKVMKNREGVERQKINLGKEQQGMLAEVQKRKELQRQLNHKQAKQAEAMVKLTREAEDIKELLAALDRQQKTQAEEEKSDGEFGELVQEDKPLKKGSKSKPRAFASAKGAIRPPAAGKVVQHFGSAREANETNKGITIKTRTNAQVTAPYDGEVVYADTFLRYGRMVILRHSDDFHTLMAGLKRIDVQVGEFLLEGEPIGAMGDESSVRLYFELRKNNQSIDPVPWLRGMKKKQ